MEMKQVDSQLPTLDRGPYSQYGSKNNADIDKNDEITYFVGYLLLSND